MLAILGRAKRAVMLEVNFSVSFDVDACEPADAKITNSVACLPVGSQVPVSALVQEQLEVGNPIADKDEPNGGDSKLRHASNFSRDRDGHGKGQGRMTPSNVTKTTR